jgi:hypothetical protein
MGTFHDLDSDDRQANREFGRDVSEDVRQLRADIRHLLKVKAAWFRGKCTKRQLWEAADTVAGTAHSIEGWVRRMTS